MLDYGCSVRRAARIFNELGCSVVGVDVLEEHLEKAKALCRDTFLREDQSESLPFAEASFDVVYSSQVIEHLHRRDGNAFIREAYALLRKGGRIFVTTPNPHYVHVLARRSPMIRGHHLSSWIIEEMADSMKNVGFTRVLWRGNGRTAVLIGDRIPCRWIYGGFAMVAEK